MTLVENIVKKAEPDANGDNDSKLKEIKAFYSNSCQKMQMYDPMDREIFGFDYEN